MDYQQKGKVVWALQPFSQTEILQQSSAWWSPGPLGSHNNHPPGDLLVLWVHTTITVSLPGNISFTTFLKWSSSRKERLCGLCNHFHKQRFCNNHPPGDLLVLWVHTTITRLVISWSFEFTQQSLFRYLETSPSRLSWNGPPAERKGFVGSATIFTNRDSATPGPLGSHNSHAPADILVLWVHTTITRLVISWSFGFTQQSPAWWSHGPFGSHNNHPPGDLLVLWVHTTITRLVISWSFGFTQQSPAWWSPGHLGSHNNHPPGDLLVLWVHTTITRLMISWSFGFTQHLPAWWSPGPLGSHYNHLPGYLLILWVHTTITPWWYVGP